MKKDNEMHRRGFLRNVVVAGGASALSVGGLGTLTRLAKGQAAEDRFYVFAYFGGGWDVLLGLDPREPDRFNPETVGETRILPGYDRLASSDGVLVRAGAQTFGPHIGELQSHIDRLAVVRGMSMETLTHEVGRRRFLTGKPPSGLLARGSTTSTYLATHFGGDEPIPNLSVRVESFNPDLPSWASALRVGSSDDLVAMLRPADPVLEEYVDEAIAQTLEAQAECGRVRHAPLLRDAEGARQRVRTLIERDLQALFDLRSEESAALRDRYGIGGDYGGPEAQAAIAAQALSSGTCRCVTIQAAGGLDTHFDNWDSDQGPRQERGFTAIARLATHLSELPYRDTGESMLDRTTIVGFSEFSRTPLINARGGRDHWLTNSCFVLGGRVRGDTIIGASSDTGMQPQPVDLATGRVSPGGEVIKPEHVLRTLMVDAGISDDAADLRVEPIAAMMR